MRQSHLFRGPINSVLVPTIAIHNGGVDRSCSSASPPRGRVMNPKKVKEKERRRARKLADEAWEAANNGDLQLAEKIIRRATATQSDNPVLWNDQGMILALAHKDNDAEESFYAALSLAPDFAEAYYHLAALCLRRGWVEKAIRLASKAVELAPETVAYRERVAKYEQMTGKEPSE